MRCPLSVVRCGLWVVGCGLWVVGRKGEVVNRPAANDARRTTDHGPRTTDHGQRTTDHGPRTTDNGQRTTDHPQTKKGPSRRGWGGSFVFRGPSWSRGQNGRGDGDVAGPLRRATHWGSELPECHVPGGTRRERRGSPAPQATREELLLLGRLLRRRRLLRGRLLRSGLLHRHVCLTSSPTPPVVVSGKNLRGAGFAVNENPWVDLAFSRQSLRSSRPPPGPGKLAGRFLSA